MKALHFLVAWIGCLALPAAALAGTMDYQGYFEDDGMPIEGEHALRFTFWTAPVGGDSLWSETQTAVPFDRGLFSVKLGSTTPLSFVVFQQPEVYLEVHLDGGAFTTRTKLGSVPYAFLADLATEATHAGTADFATHAEYADSAGSGGGAGDSPWLPPIGTILPFYEFSDSEPLIFDTTHWAICDGSTVVINGISRTLPDLSGRYLIGFGTDGSGDIGTAPFQATAVGNAGHSVNLQHTHTVDVANFTSATSGEHDHYSGIVVSQDYNGLGIIETSPAGSQDIDLGGVYGQSPHITYAAHVVTSDDGSHTHSVNPPSTQSGNALSASQSVQPRSIRIRYIMRIR